MKLSHEQMINLIDIIDQASLTEAIETQTTQDQDLEKRTEEIRTELKQCCIEIESRGLVKCRKTDITSHKIKMTNTKQDKKCDPYHTIAEKNSN